MLNPLADPSKRSTGVLPMMLVLNVGLAEPEAVELFALLLLSVHVATGSPSFSARSLERYHTWRPVKSDGKTDGPDEITDGTFQNPRGIGIVANALAGTSSPAAVRMKCRRLWRVCSRHSIK